MVRILTIAGRRFAHLRTHARNDYEPLLARSMVRILTIDQRAAHPTRAAHRRFRWNPVLQSRARHLFNDQLRRADHSGLLAELAHEKRHFSERLREATSAQLFAKARLDEVERR